MLKIIIKYCGIILFLVNLSFSQNEFQNFISRVNSIASTTDKNAAIDSFLVFARSEGIPFIENTTANFIYRGAASSVAVASDFNGWSATINPLIKLSGTNFFYFSKNFEPNARLDYKFVLNNSNWILDPENRNQIMGGYGPNSELAMPDYVQPWEVKYKPSIKHGTVVSKSIYSSYAASNYQLQIYLPPNYDSLSSGYPTVYFQDGFEYISLASAINVIDNLIDSNKIQPLIAVFVKPNNRNEEYADSKRNQYRLFFVNELVPFIDSTYNTIINPTQRLVIGDSYGGNISALISYNHADVFGNCGIHSGAFQPNNFEAFNLIVNGQAKNIKFVSVWGTYESLFSNMRSFKDSCINKGYQFYWKEFPEGHSWGLWRATIDYILENIFPGNPTSFHEALGRSDFKIFQNYPNPFNSSTRIRFMLPATSFTSLKVYNILGNEIATLIQQNLKSGFHEITFNTDLQKLFSSGVYFCKLTTDYHSETIKILHIK